MMLREHIISEGASTVDMDPIDHNESVVQVTHVHVVFENMHLSRGVRWVCLSVQSMALRFTDIRTLYQGEMEGLKHNKV